MDMLLVRNDRDRQDAGLVLRYCGSVREKFDFYFPSMMKYNFYY